MNREAEMISNALSPDTALQALFNRWPVTIPVFIRHRMSCVGCSMAVFDTVEEAAANYGLECTALLAELQAAIQPGTGPIAAP
jgi:hybrid cluster-associated redox disulfide protein